MSSDIESGKPTNLKVVNASLNGNHYTSMDNNPLENDTSRRKFIQRYSEYTGKPDYGQLTMPPLHPARVHSSW